MDSGEFDKRQAIQYRGAIRRAQGDRIHRAYQVHAQSATAKCMCYDSNLHSNI